MRTSGKTGQAGWWVLLAIVWCLAMFVAGCGDDDEPESEGSGGGSAASGEVEEIVFANGSVVAESSAPYVAEAQGYFEEEGVKVKFLNDVGSNVANLIVSGQADLASAGFGTPLTLTSQGRDNSVIFTNLSNGVAASVIATDKAVTTMEQLKGKRIGVLAKGTSTYGSAAFYNTKFGLDADLIPFADTATTIAALASGQIDAAVGTASVYDAFVDEGKGHFVLDMRDQDQRRETVGEDYPEVGYYGLKENLQEKKDAITKFMVAVLRANEWMKEAPDAEVAKVLRTQQIFQQFPEPLLTKQVAGAKAFWTATDPGDGSISEDQWNVTIERLSGWGLAGFTPDNYQDEMFSFGSMVDMSYHDAAAQELEGR